MAKKLEEHLYRTATTRDDYIESASLKRRLHLIAKGVGLSKDGDLDGDFDPIAMALADALPEGTCQQEQPVQPLEATSQGINNPPSSSANNQAQGQRNQESICDEKKKSIILLQQQRRLLLLRHASKCTSTSCTTRFCSQMRILWNHMKACREKSCKVAHCLSSRCILNHYRSCKSSGKTINCNICGPVMQCIQNGTYDLSKLGDANGIQGSDDGGGSDFDLFGGESPVLDTPQQALVQGVDTSELVQGIASVASSVDKLIDDAPDKAGLNEVLNETSKEKNENEANNMKQMQQDLAKKENLLQQVQEQKVCEAFFLVHVWSKTPLSVHLN